MKNELQIKAGHASEGSNFNANAEFCIKVWREEEKLVRLISKKLESIERRFKNFT